MADATTVARGPEGRAVVVKQGDPRRLGHERAMLRRAAHPGVVALADGPEDLVEGGDGVLCTVFVGGGTVAEHLSRSVGAGLAVELAISLSSTVADLHDRGIAHRRLTADHVLVGAGRAVVCGLAEAVLAADARPADFGRDDVAAVARLVADLAAGAGTGAEATSLGQVAHRALDASPEGRPSMRGLAGALAGLAPEETEAASRSRRPGARRLTPRATRRQVRHRFPWVPLPGPGVAAGCVLAVAVLGWQLLASAGAGSKGPPAPAATASPSAPSSGSPRPGPGTLSATTPTRPPSDRAPRRLWPLPTCPTVAAPAADLDGDGCAEPVHVEAGLVSSTDRRWQVAGPDDVVTVGDWDCDGRATPAVLRPGSGEVWVFDRWADAGDEVAASLAGVVRGAASAKTVPAREGTAAGCDRIEVLHPDDTSTVVTPPSSSPDRTPAPVSAGGWPPRWPGAGRRG